MFGAHHIHSLHAPTLLRTCAPIPHSFAFGRASHFYMWMHTALSTALVLPIDPPNIMHRRQAQFLTHPCVRGFEPHPQKVAQRPRGSQNLLSRVAEEAHRLLISLRPVPQALGLRLPLAGQRKASMTRKDSYIPAAEWQCKLLSIFWYSTLQYSLVSSRLYASCMHAC
jgi:hypothetical protein|eukprot:COSAG06_NODE_4938_length_3846_cov_29.655006_6_plen_168_part_00